MPPLRLCALSVLLPVMSLVQCRVAAPSESEAAAAAAAPQSAAASSGPNVLTGAGGIWINDSEARIRQKLSDLRALNLEAITLKGRRTMLVGQGLEVGERALGLARAAGVKVWFHPHEYNRPTLERVGLAQYREGGRAWGALACRYRDVVAGFDVQNEFDLPVRRAAEGRREEVARLHTSVIRLFAEGVKESCPTMPVYAGSVAFPHREEASYAVSFLADAIRAGTIDGVGANVYEDCNDLVDDGRGGLRLRRSPGDVFGGFLERAGLPSDTPIHIAEANIVRTSCGSDAEAARALRTLLYELSADPRVVRVFPFSPWPPRGNTAERYTIRPGTPVGDAVAAWAADPTAPPRGSR